MLRYATQDVSFDLTCQTISVGKSTFRLSKDVQVYQEKIKPSLKYEKFKIIDLKTLKFTTFEELTKLPEWSIYKYVMFTMHKRECIFIYFGDLASSSTNQAA
jgi:hypothetical protein